MSNMCAGVCFKTILEKYPGAYVEKKDFLFFSSLLQSSISIRQTPEAHFKRKSMMGYPPHSVSSRRKRTRERDGEWAERKDLCSGFRYNLQRMLPVTSFFQ